MKHSRVAMLVIMLLYSAKALVASEPLEAANLLQTLHKAQDDIARGDTSALAIQSELIELLRASLENPLHQRSDRREWEVTAIGYALDGATPKLARRILTTIGTDSPLHALAVAVSEYSVGNMKIAGEQFSKLDIVHLDARIAPYIMLAMATSNLELDPKKSIQEFQQAALLAPGTLIEEVALRRLANLSLSENDAALFKVTANLYLRRYKKSPFAPQFYKALIVGATTHLTDFDAKAAIDIIGKQSNQNHTSILLSLSERYAIAGKFEIVKYIFDNILSKSEQKSQEHSDRLELYKYISKKSERNPIFDNVNLQKINKKSLSIAETQILSKLEATNQAISQPLALGIADVNVERANSFFQPAEVSMEKSETSTTNNVNIGTRKDELPQKSVSETRKASDQTEQPTSDPLINDISATVSKASQDFDAIDRLIEGSKL